MQSLKNPPQDSSAYAVRPRGAALSGMAGSLAQQEKVISSDPASGTGYPRPPNARRPKPAELQNPEGEKFQLENSRTREMQRQRLNGTVR